MQHATAITHAMDNTARGAAVVAYVNGYGDVVRAVRACYADGDWGGIQSALDKMTANFEAMKPRVASLKSIISREGKGRDDRMTISFKGKVFTVTAQLSERAREQAISLSNLRKTFETLRTMRDQVRRLEEQGLPGATSLLDELAYCWEKDIQLPEFEFEQRREVIAIIRSEEA